MRTTIAETHQRGVSAAPRKNCPFGQTFGVTSLPAAAKPWRLQGRLRERKLLAGGCAALGQPAGNDRHVSALGWGRSGFHRSGRPDRRSAITHRTAELLPSPRWLPWTRTLSRRGAGRTREVRHATMASERESMPFVLAPPFVLVPPSPHTIAPSRAAESRASMATPNGPGSEASDQGRPGCAAPCGGE